MLTGNTLIFPERRQNEMTFEKKYYGDLKIVVRKTVLSPDRAISACFGVFL